nr:hypothetical protein [Tanacetum cinerariifolium]
VTKTATKEKALNGAKTAPGINILDFYEEHYEDILPVMDKIRHDKQREVHIRLDFEENSRKSQRMREDSQNSSAKTLSARYRKPSERPRMRDHLRNNDGNVFGRLGHQRESAFKRLSDAYLPSATKSGPDREYSRDDSYSRGLPYKRNSSTSRDRPRSSGRSHGVEESYGNTYSSNKTWDKHRYHSHDTGRSSSMKRGRTSESPLSRVSESDTSEGGHWKSKSKRRKPTNEEDLTVPWSCEDVGDPEDHVKIFQAATHVERWAMPTWCHMFNSTLIGSAKVWFDELPPESIDGYTNLKAAFLAYFMQQKKYVKDPVEIHNIKQKDGETIEEFIERFKIETGQTASASKKKVHTPWKSQDQSKRQNSERRPDFKNQPKDGRGSNKFTRLTRTPKEIFTAESGKFKPPPPMVTPVEKRNNSKFCEFYNDKGHSTDECVQLRKQIEELLRADKLSHFIKEIRMTQSFAHVKEITFPPLDSNKGTGGPLVIEAEISGHAVHQIYIDGGSSMEVLYEHCFNRLRPEIKSQMVLATTSLTGFSGETIWPQGELRLLVTIGDAELPSTAHGMLKFPVNGEIVTIRSTILTPTECTTIAATPKDHAKKAEARHKIFKVAIHPDFLDQEISIGGTVSIKAQTELCTLLKRNLDIFAWQPSDKIGVSRLITEHRLNIREGYSPVTQKKQGQASKRAKAIQVEVQKLMNLESTQNNGVVKFSLLKQGGYEMWKLRKEQHFQVQDYALWDVIENGNSFNPVPRTTTNADVTSTSTISGPVTTEEKAQKKNDVKARSMLLMALPSEHLLTFSQYKDAKTLFEAIQVRFTGNDATKKTQNTLLKQIYKNFNTPSTKSLDSIFNRLQKIVSQLAILRNKADLDTMSIDDLYNNFKIVEQEVKRTVTSSSSLGSQNMAFLSSPGSTNEVDTANIQVSTVSTPVSTISAHDNTANLSDATVYAFLANQPNGSQLVYEDLEQIHEDDMEEMDLKWQLALLSIRARRYFQRTGKKSTINESDNAGYDKTRVECFNCHKMGYFARECRSPRNQESRPRNQDNSRNTMNVEDTSSKEMVAIDGAGIKNQLNHQVKIIRCDNGTGFKNYEMNQFCGIKWIKREFSNAMTSQQNGVAERKNRTLIEAGRTMLADSLLPIPFWDDAVSTGCYVHNRVLVTKPHNKTPYELLIGITPIISFMRPFGCLVTILNTLDHLGQAGKEEVPDQEYILLLLMNTCSDVPLSHKEVDSSLKDNADKNSTAEPTFNVASSSFSPPAALDDFSKMPNLEDTGIFDDAYNDIDKGVEADYNDFEAAISVSPIPSTRIHKDYSKKQIIGEVNSVVQTRKMAKQNEVGLITFINKQKRTNHKDFQKNLFACFLSQMEPKKVTQALDDESWVEAMQEVLFQFKLLNVWTLVDLPHGKRAIGTK